MRSEDVTRKHARDLAFVVQRDIEEKRRPDAQRRVAQILNIPFFILNVEREFGARVIDAFVDSYLDGATPNPCIRDSRSSRRVGTS